MTEGQEEDERDRLCESRRTVQLGPMSATDLRCMRPRWNHLREHTSWRRFGEVEMSARWMGEWTEDPNG